MGSRLTPDLPPAAAAALSAELVVLAAADRLRAPDPKWVVEAVRAAVRGSSS